MSTQQPTGNNMPAVAGLAILGVAFIALAIFYVVANTTFLASSAVPHYKHAAACAVAAVACFIAANFVRQRAV